LLGADSVGKKQKCSFRWVKYIVSPHLEKISPAKEQYKEKNSWMKLEISLLDHSEQNRKLQIFIAKCVL